MKTIRQFIIATSLALTLNQLAYAEAPIIDDSENYATAGGQSAPVNDRPIAHDSLDDTPQEKSAMYGESSNNGSKKIQDLEQEVQELRGQLEVQQHELQKLKDQQLAFYKDLDARIQANKSTTTLNTPSTNTSTPLSTSSIKKNDSTPSLKASKFIQSKPGSDTKAYTHAFTLINQKKSSEAIEAMQDFLAQYPSSSYASNAHYWLGELYMQKTNYPDAITEFNAVINDYPNANKKADAHLKLAYALLSSGQIEDAKQRLREVIKTYPDTQTAQMAALKLQSIHA